MSTLEQSAIESAPPAAQTAGVRLHRFTVAEYHIAYEDPSGPTAIPAYRASREYREGESLPLVAREQSFDAVPVDVLLARK